VGVHKTVVEMTDDEWDFQVDTQFRAVFLTFRAAGRQMIAQGRGGRIRRRRLLGGEDLDRWPAPDGVRSYECATEVRCGMQVDLCSSDCCTPQSPTGFSGGFDG
jgi:hypothetical protein